MRRRYMQIAAMVSLLVGTALAADDWPRFRGDDGAGVSKDQRIPDSLDLTKSLVWKRELPDGTSSPIVVGERLFLTSHEGEQRTLHCLHAITGEMLWERHVTKEHQEIATQPAGPATPTPASDGSRVFVFFPDAGLFAWTVEGEELWKQPTAVSKTMHGLSGSLVCFEDRVFQVVDQLNDSFVRAIDSASGKEVWRTDRVSGLTGGYSTPVTYAPPEKNAQLITTGPFEVVSYDVKTGERIWWVIGKSNAPVSSPVLRGDRLYFCEPVAGAFPISMLGSMDANKDGKIDVAETSGNEAIRRLIIRIDDNWGNKDASVDEAEWNKAFQEFLGKGGLLAMDVTGQGDVTDSHVKWTFGKGMPYIPGVLATAKSITAIDDGGIVTAIDPGTGQQLHKGRLSKGNGQYYASPVAAGDRMVVVDTSGVINILNLSEKWTSEYSGELGESCFATPAIAHNCLYVRTAKGLYCFGAHQG
jgi:outer membrane protein assembly factor BamB